MTIVWFDESIIFFLQCFSFWGCLLKLLIKICSLNFMNYGICIGPRCSLSRIITPTRSGAMEQYRDIGYDRDRFIASSYQHHIIAVLHFHVIAPSPSRHYHGTIASSSSHHRHSTIMSSLHPELKGVIVNWVGLSGFHMNTYALIKFKKFIEEKFVEFYTERLLNISSALVSIHNLLMLQFMTLRGKLGCLKI